MIGRTNSGGGAGSDYDEALKSGGAYVYLSSVGYRNDDTSLNWRNHGSMQYDNTYTKFRNAMLVEFNGENSTGDGQYHKDSEVSIAGRKLTEKDVNKTVIDLPAGNFEISQSASGFGDMITPLRSRVRLYNPNIPE